MITTVMETSIAMLRPKLQLESILPVIASVRLLSGLWQQRVGVISQ